MMSRVSIVQYLCLRLRTPAGPWLTFSGAIQILNSFFFKGLYLVAEQSKEKIQIPKKSKTNTPKEYIKDVDLHYTPIVFFFGDIHFGLLFPPLPSVS